MASIHKTQSQSVFHKYRSAVARFLVIDKVYRLDLESEEWVYREASCTPRKLPLSERRTWIGTRPAREP
jgi:hypothetical protein